MAVQSTALHKRREAATEAHRAATLDAALQQFAG